MVLGTHILDLMRLLAGDARWCFARVGVAGKQRVAPVAIASCHGFSNSEFTR